MAFNSQMHERNIYKNRPDFARIALNYPEFRKYALSDAKGKVRVDFTDPDALRILTKILLKKDFNLTVEIPKGFLIPTVPQRLNYILWMEDLLSILKNKNKMFHGIDIGCGPCAIFSILGAKKNGWMFTATETSGESLQWALNNIKANDLGSLIKVMKVDSNSALREVLSSNEDYDFCLCNPPFFENMEDIRKKPPRVKESITTIVKKEEIFAEGGEVAFVKRIIEESLIFKNRIKLYTSMFGKKKSFVEIFKVLQGIKDIAVTKSQFCQGNTIRWGIAWTFEKSVNFGTIEKPKPKKTKKVKPPLVHPIPKDIKCPNYNVQELSKIIWNTLKDLKILIKVVRVHEHYTESQITTDNNTWSHQRRKRREMKHNVENTGDINLSPNKISECELITANTESKSPKSADITSTSSVSMTGAQVGETASFYASKGKSLATKIESENLKPPASEESHMSFDNSFKKRKLVEDNSSSCKKPRIDSEQSEQNEMRHEPVSQCSKDISADNSDSNQQKQELIEINTDSKSVKSADISTTPSIVITDASGETDSFLASKNISLFAKKEKEDLKRAAPEEGCISSGHTFKKRRLVEDNSSVCKKPRISLEQSEQIEPTSELINQCSKDSSVDDSNQQSSTSSHLLKKPKEEWMDIVRDSESTIHSEDFKESERVQNKATNLIKAEDISDVNFEPKSLLFCTLKIRRAKDFVLIEMNCPDEANRESMYQILQHLKNKLH
ncbi:RNA N(6)-adenosine-methyltransferase mettl16 isoform X1 [Parasteatoda tepidariorum]|uniref:RNA N(6)-adenosine-methyltransferase mettl16 isoform X1 n=2 Tax=Parasteatoda tepidariorum TaxID=114398 RepID=UPI00077FB787|nr:RNA N6-adenosine-methyltransferase mettl16 isoform X1 [Parasteatoda tepidariorum]